MEISHGGQQEGKISHGGKFPPCPPPVVTPMCVGNVRFKTLITPIDLNILRDTFLIWVRHVESSLIVKPRKLNYLTFSTRVLFIFRSGYVMDLCFV